MLEDADFTLTTAIRRDPLLLTSPENALFAGAEVRGCQFYMLRFHQERLLAAAKAFGRECDHWEGEVGLERLRQQLDAWLNTSGLHFKDCPYKVGPRGISTAFLNSKLKAKLPADLDLPKLPMSNALPLCQTHRTHS